jgi:4-amino-4-deoxy-L-arabinose transferase-like glycosyltransferase
VNIYPAGMLARMPVRFALPLPLIAIAILATLLRMVWGLSRPGDDASLAVLPDQIEYLEVARSLLAGGGFAFVDDRFGESLRAFRLPGYPLLMALCAAEPWVIRIAQALLDGSTVIASALIAQRLIGGRSPYIAGTLVALDPFAVYFSGLLLSETLFMAMITWAVALCVLRRDRNDADAAWWCGIVLMALASLVKPLAVPILLVVVPASVILRRGSDADTLVRTLLALLVLGAVMSLWLVRNHRVVGAAVYSTNSGFTLFDGLHDGATGASDQQFATNMVMLRELDEVERSRRLTGLAVQWAVGHPLEVMRLAGVKAARTWSPMPLGQAYRGNPAVLIAALAWSMTVFALAVLGLFRGRWAQGAMLLLLGPLLAMTLVHAVTVGSLRYRAPLHPLLVLLACGGLASIAPAGISRPIERADPRPVDQ